MKLTSEDSFGNQLIEDMHTSADSGYSEFNRACYTAADFGMFEYAEVVLSSEDARIELSSQGDVAAVSKEFGKQAAVSSAVGHRCG